MQAKLKKNVIMRKAWRTFENLLPILYHVAAFFVGAFAAATPIYGNLRPFGLALAAGIQPTWALATSAGAALGYALTQDITLAVPYLACVCSIALVRTLLTVKNSTITLFAPSVIGSIVLIISKTIIAAIEATGFLVVITTLAECAMLVGMAYLFKDVFSAIILHNSGVQNGALVFGYMAAIAIISPLNFYGVQPAHIACGVILLGFACNSHQKTAAILGIAGAAALTAVSPQNIFAALGLAVGALAAGVFAPSQRINAAFVFFAAGFTGILAAPSVTSGLLFGVELCISAALFLVLPQTIFHGNAFADERDVRRAATAQLSARVDAMAEALSCVGETVNHVCEKLPKKGESFATVCDCVAENICSKCKRRVFCWVDCYNDTMASLSALAPELAHTGHVQTKSLDNEILRRCLTPERLALGITLEYNAWQTRKAARAQGEIMRSALTEQFKSVAYALESFSKELWLEGVPDKKKAYKVEELMRSIGTQPFDVRVVEDRDTRMHVEIRLPRINFKDNELAVLTDEISDICKRNFSDAQCRHLGGATVLDFYERALFDVAFACSGIAAQKGVSGDAYRTFCDGHGMAYALLCDGMGTGSDAAIDGHMAACLTTRLVQAGFASKEAARLVNVALSLKGDDEAGATLDVLSINLYTGKAHLFKAGGAPTFIIHNGRATKIGEDSLPIGILQTVVGQESTFSLAHGDTAILVSDGALEDGEEWFCAQLELTANDDPQTLCGKATAAAKRRANKRPDDITVLAVRII